MHELYTFSLPLALWFRLVLSVVAWIVPMSNELEKDGRNQNDPNCPWQKSFRKRNGNLSPSRASCQATLPHASQVSTNPASRPLMEEVLVWHYHRQTAAILLVYKRYRSRTWTCLSSANAIAQNYAHANVRFGIDLFTLNKERSWIMNNNNRDKN